MQLWCYPSSRLKWSSTKSHYWSLCWKQNLLLLWVLNFFNFHLSVNSSFQVEWLCHTSLWIGFASDLKLTWTFPSPGSCSPYLLQWPLLHGRKDGLQWGADAGKLKEGLRAFTSAVSSESTRSNCAFWSTAGLSLPCRDLVGELTLYGNGGFSVTPCLFCIFLFSIFWLSSPFSLVVLLYPLFADLFQYDPSYLPALQFLVLSYCLNSPLTDLSVGRSNTFQHASF